MCLVCSWTLVYGILVKGIKSAGKAVYFTALLPYVILLIFLIRGLMLPNMSNGYKVLFTPRVFIILKILEFVPQNLSFRHV